MTLTIEQLKLAFNSFKSFRLNASMALFEKVFGPEMAEYYWFKFSEVYHSDIYAFWGYIDEAYKEILLTYILNTIVPRIEKAKMEA